MGSQFNNARVRALEVGTSQAAKSAKPAEMGLRLFGLDAHDRHVQEPPDRRRDLAKRDAFVADGVERAAGGAALDRQAEDLRRIEAVHGRPAVEPFADIGRHAFFARKRIKHRNEPLLAQPVHGGRQPDGRCAHPSLGERDRRLFRSAGIRVGNRNGRVVLGGDRSRHLDRDPGGHEQRALRAHERVAEGLDGAPVDLAVSLEVGEVMNERAVDHAVARGGAGFQAVEFFDRAALDFGAGGGDLCGRGVGTSEADDRMAGAHEVGGDDRADEPARAGDENTHGRRLPVGLAHHRLLTYPGKYVTLYRYND